MTRPIRSVRGLVRRRGFVLVGALAIVTGACQSSAQSGGLTAPNHRPTPREAAFLDTVARRTFDWFWETTNPRNGLVPDRWPTKSFSSVAAVGFGLTAYVVGVERGWVPRDEARARVLTTLRFFRDAPQGPGTGGITGYKGFFYHFLDMETGRRFERVELSTIDTGLLLMGVLACREYFDRGDAGDAEVRALADTIYRRVDWPWATNGAPSLTMGWHPENVATNGGFIEARWIGYNEAMLLYALALGSPTHSLAPAAWDAWTGGYKWGDFHGQTFVQFAPLFGHQYSHTWIDYRGIRDAYMRARGGPSAAGGTAHMDYFENTRRATLSQRAYATANPGGWRGYGPLAWGLTASDGPLDSTLAIDGRTRTFHTYWARGAGGDEVNDDGTLVPTAVGGSVPFAPEITIPTLVALRERYGEPLFGRYGFVDAFNPTVRDAAIPVRQGRIVPGTAWFDTDYLGIDQGPILLMVENYRTELVWRLIRKNPDIVRGLCRAGFSGGWLTGRC